MKHDITFALENAGWPALLVDGASIICRANSAAVRLFGPALEGDLPHLSAIWSPENTSSAEQFLAQWERAPAPTVTLKLRGKGGATLSQLASICSLNRDGQKVFVIQLLPEITLPARELKGANGDAGLAHKQKLDCALQLARTVSLDFNNALTSILGHTSLILGQMEPDHPWRRSLLEVEKSAAHGAEIANDLGAFSRQEKDSHGQTSGNLNLLLQHSVDFFKEHPPADPLEWNLVLERKLFAAKFDEAKMQQAFMKILENALEAVTGYGRITVQSRNVELAGRAQDRNVQLAPGAYVCIEISDNGAGISAEVLPRIFEPFFTTKGGKHRGLGLAWVYGIVTNHGGGVAVSSQPASGTSVRVYLPAEKHIVGDSEMAASDLRGDQTILFVDDEEPVLTLGQMILSAYGYQVLTASTGQKALELIAGKKPVDLVVTDLVMPSMSGRELIERIRQSAPDLRILSTSGCIWPAGQEQEGAYLQKPFTSQELLLKVKQVLER